MAKKLKMGKGLLDLVHPIGSTYISESNVNPQTLFGGTWKLVDMEYKPIHYRDDDALTSINATASALYIVRSGHTVRFRSYFATTVELRDSLVELFQINLQKIGISNLYMQILQGLMGTDGGNCIILYNLAYGTGIVSSVEVISKDGTGICPVGATGYINIVVPVDFEFMIDSFCDKFYWRRTA